MQARPPPRKVILVPVISQAHVSLGRNHTNKWEKTPGIRAEETESGNDWSHRSGFHS
jgi:hypothetical protein